MLIVGRLLCGGGGVYENSVLFNQFYCENKFALRNNFFLEIAVEERIHWELGTNRYKLLYIK